MADISIGELFLRPEKEIALSRDINTPPQETRHMGHENGTLSGESFIEDHYGDFPTVWSEDIRRMWRKLRTGNRAVWDLAAEQLRGIPKEHRDLRERVKAAVGTVYLTSLLHEGVERGALDSKITRGTSLASLVQSDWISSVPKEEVDKIRRELLTANASVTEEAVVEELLSMKQAVAHASPVLDGCLNDLMEGENRNNQLVILRAAIASIGALSVSIKEPTGKSTHYIPTKTLQIGTAALAGALDAITTGVGLREGLVELNPLLHEISTLFPSETGMTALEIARVTAVIFEAAIYLLKVRNDNMLPSDPGLDEFPEEYEGSPLRAIKEFVTKPNTILTSLTLLQFADVLSNISLLASTHSR